MKVSVILLWLLELTLAAPQVLTIRSALAAEAYDDSQGMKWVGEIFPGQNHTLYGDAKSIYDQIMAINPKYVAKVQHLPRDLSKRAKDSGPCGNFATATGEDINTGYFHLRDIGGACHVNGRSCVRLSCDNTSGNYLCNDNAGAIAPQCGYLASYVWDILWSCGGGTIFAHMSGQEFDTDRYNVISAYANCRHSASTRPNTYQKWGPNGSPFVTCGRCVKVKQL